MLRLLADPGIVRRRGTIEATLGNARALIDVAEGQGVARLVRDHVGGIPIRNDREASRRY